MINYEELEKFYKEKIEPDYKVWLEEMKRLKTTATRNFIISLVVAIIVRSHSWRRNSDLLHSWFLMLY
ncbi:MAG: hypothetical protein FWC68_06645 [Oscillospiraceae bacterium]|nr:hypothetical protein [Oscillospiraceae bacterium]